MGKRKQETLPEMPDINGKLIDTTTLFIAIPEKVEDIEIRKLDDDRIRLVHGDLVAGGDTIEDAIKAFKRAYKAQR